MHSTLDNNSGHQNESLSPMTSGLVHSHKADARSLLTHFKLDLKYNHCMQQQPMQCRGNVKELNKYMYHMQRKVC